jgi:hypothetical protein
MEAEEVYYGGLGGGVSRLRRYIVEAQEVEYPGSGGIS